MNVPRINVIKKGGRKPSFQTPRGGAISIKAPLGGDINVAHPGFGSDDHPKHFRSSWSDLQPSRLYECQSSTDTKSAFCECHRCSLQCHCLQRCIHWPSHLEALCMYERSNASAPGHGGRCSACQTAHDNYRVCTIAQVLPLSRELSERPRQFVHVALGLSDKHSARS